jgi:hypothetical protein
VVLENVVVRNLAIHHKYGLPVIYGLDLRWAQVQRLPLVLFIPLRKCSAVAGPGEARQLLSNPSQNFWRERVGMEDHALRENHSLGVNIKFSRRGQPKIVKYDIRIRNPLGCLFDKLKGLNSHPRPQLLFGGDLAGTELGYSNTPETVRKISVDYRGDSQDDSERRHRIFGLDLKKLRVPAAWFCFCCGYFSMLLCVLLFCNDGGIPGWIRFWGGLVSLGLAVSVAHLGVQLIYP